MVQTVSRFPEGILRLLGIAKAPEPFFFRNDFLTPIIDAEPFFLLTSRTVRLGTTEVAAVGNTTGITVPVGELWWVHGAFEATDILDADQAIEFNQEMVTNGESFYLPPVIVPASRRGASFFQQGSRGPIILRAGDLFRASVTAVTVGAAGTVQLNTRVLLSQIQ